MAVRVGVLGCGNVGAPLVELIGTQGPTVEARTGLRLEVTRVAVRDLAKPRPISLSADLLTTDAAIDRRRPGHRPRRRAHRRRRTGARADPRPPSRPASRWSPATRSCSPSTGPSCSRPPRRAGVDLLFEAAVAGGIPIIRPLRESLVGERITRVMGIVNGTTNYILTRMTEAGASYADALAEAQALGFAEADPTADVEGYDAGAKAAIIASIAFGAAVTAADVHHEGISGIAEVDIEFARKMGFVIKLLAVAEQTDDGAIGVRVHPTMVPVEHPLASVRESFNAIFVEGAAVGDLMFYGRGAGGSPTASAILGDLIDAAVNRHKGSHASVGPAEQGGAAPDRRGRVGLLPQPRGARPARRSRPGGRRVRRQRRVDPLDGAGGARRRGPPHLHHAPRPRGRRPGHAACAARARGRRPDRLGDPGRSAATSQWTGEVRLDPRCRAGAGLRRRAPHGAGRRRRPVRPGDLADPVLRGVGRRASLRRRGRRRHVALRGGRDRP